MDSATSPVGTLSTSPATVAAFISAAIASVTIAYAIILGITHLVKAIRNPEVLKDEEAWLINLRQNVLPVLFRLEKRTFQLLDLSGRATDSNVGNQAPGRQATRTSQQVSGSQAIGSSQQVPSRPAQHSSKLPRLSEAADL